MVWESFLEGFHQFFGTVSVLTYVLHKACRQYGPGTCHTTLELKD